MLCSVGLAQEAADPVLLVFLLDPSLENSLLISALQGIDVHHVLATSSWLDFQAPPTLGTPASYNVQAHSAMGQKPKAKVPCSSAVGDR